MHQATVIAGHKPMDLLESHWIYPVLGNLKTNLSGCYHAIRLNVYTDRYLAAFTYGFKRHLILRTLNERLHVATAHLCHSVLRISLLADDHC